MNQTPTIHFDPHSAGLINQAPTNNVDLINQAPTQDKSNPHEFFDFFYEFRDDFALF